MLALMLTALLLAALPVPGALAGPVAPASGPPSAVLPDFRGVEEAAHDAVGSGEIPGVVVLVGQGDDVLYHRAWGWRALLPDAIPMTRDTIFDIASLTKPVGTTLAVMMLVERGAVALDAPLGRYLKEFRRPEYQRVTIRRLLTHSAGFPPTPASKVLKVGFPRAAKPLAHIKLAYTPGWEFDYSDTGFILLGEVVRRVSGHALDEYLARSLFRPLGLKDTSFHPPAAVRERVAPTEFHEGRMLRGDVHDPRARELKGIAGHAGMFSTAADLARICQMLVGGGQLGGKRILRPATIEEMWTRSPEGRGTRALGWDISSTYARIMMPFFPSGSVGHTGFTGTSIWIHPPSGTYLILLTNRVHPNGGGAARIKELRTRMAAAVGAALFRGALPATVLRTSSAAASDVVAATNGREPAAGPREPSGDRATALIPVPHGGAGTVRTGIDVLVDQGFAPLAGHTVGVVTNQTGIDARGRRTIDLLAAAPGVRLRAIFSPEHGIHGDVDANVPNSRDRVTGLPIWSLYGATRRPTAAMLEGIGTLVFDIQDVGARYYTYLATLVNVMEEAARHGIKVFVLDRPNPITGRVVEGPLTDADLQSFTAPHAIPVRTGMTIGEFARLAALERQIPVTLTVVPMAGWERGRWFDQTGLPWVNPSPNIRSLTQALLYSGVGLLEATNLSVGRGTDMPFEVVGAPWIEPQGTADALNQLGLRGVRFEPVWFTPRADHYANVLCGGVRFVVTDRDAIRPVTMALALAEVLRSRYRAEWRPEAVQNLLANRSTMWAFLRSEPLDRIMALVETERQLFLNRRASYLIYP